jgi:hypothetical protein
VSASRASDGTVIATNNGVTYALSPAMLLVSEGDNVLYRDPWIEFRQPRFSAAPVTPSATPSATRPQAPTSTSSTPPTVSTTTVTMPPVTTRPGW